MIKIATDSNSGISQEEAKELGISVIPMPFVIDGVEYYDGVTLDHEGFYQHLENDASVSTSQPSQYTIKELWDNLLVDSDKLIFIPMSSGLKEVLELYLQLWEHTDSDYLFPEYEGKQLSVGGAQYANANYQSIKQR